MRPGRQRGLTLIELVIVLFILALMATASVPMLNGAMAQRRLMGAVGKLASDLRLIQSQAAMRGSVHRLQLTGSTYVLQRQVGAAWTAISASTQLSRTYKDVDLLSIRDNDGAGANVTAIAFSPSGAIDNPTVFQFPIVLRVGTATTSRVINVTRAGAIRIPAN